MCVAAIGVIGPIIGAIASLAGSMVAAAGAQQQAEAQAQAAAFQAAVARNNQTAEAYKATEKAQDVAQKGEYALAKQRAAFAASGAQVDTGTPVTVFGASAGRVEGAVADVHYEGALETARWADQAKLKDMEAANARKAGQYAAAGAIISGIGGAASAFKGGGNSSGGSGQALSVFG